MISNTTKLIAINVIAHLLIIPGIIYGTWYMWVLSIIWWQLIVATSIASGYHRYFSHNAFNTHKAFELYVQIIGMFANAGPVLTWASTHKMHHAFSDSPNDPHSPVYKSFLTVYCNTWGHSTTINRKFLKKLISNKSLLFFYRYYFRILLCILVGLMLINPLLLIFGFAIPVVLAFHGYGLINAYGHKNGYPSNNILVSIFTAGEGQHATHHKYPRNWKIGSKWYHFDISSVFIKLIKYND